MLFASFLPLIAFIYLITLIFSFDLSIDHKTYSILYYEILFAVTIVFSLIIFFVYNHVKWLKIVVGIFSLGLGALFGFVLFISLIFTNFGESKIIQTVNSPDDTYPFTYKILHLVFKSFHSVSNTANSILFSDASVYIDLRLNFSQSHKKTLCLAFAIIRDRR